MIKVVTWNLLFGGRDDEGHGDDTRWRRQADLLRDLAPDVLLLQECNLWDARGFARLHQAVYDTGMARGVLAEANATTAGHKFHTAILVSPQVRLLSHGADTHRYHHVCGWAHLGVDGLDRPLELRNIHLDPFDGDRRLSEVKPFEVLAAPGRLAIVAGDANTVPPSFPEEALRLTEVPAHIRGGWVLDPQADPPVADRRALAFLAAAGFADTADLFGAGMIPTAERRCDVIYTSPAATGSVKGYRVVTEAGRLGELSDHHPVEVLIDW